MCKLIFKINIKNLLYRFLLAVTFIFALQSICSCDGTFKFNVGDEGDIKLDLLNGHTTPYTFYYSNPSANPNTEHFSARYKIGNVMHGDLFFPKSMKEGYRASWVCFNSEDNEDLSMPANLHLEEIDGILFASLVLITQQPLEFYASSWVARSDTPYKVNHYKQKLGLDDYDLFDIKNYELDFTEQKQGTTDTKVSLNEIKKEYAGFEYVSIELGDTNGIITGNGKCEVNIFYNRKVISIAIDSNGGTFTDGSGDVQKVLTGRYGEPVKLPEVKLKNYHIDRYLKVETDEEAKTIETFPAENGIYKIIWAEDKKYKYKVQHLLQKVSATEPSASEAIYDATIGRLESGGKTYYTYYTLGKEEIKEDFALEMTKAELATEELISNISNYKWNSTEEKAVRDDESTVVKVLYDVKPFDITFDANDGQGGIITQTFYTETDCIMIMQSSNTGFKPMVPENHYKFESWNTEMDGSGTKYKDKDSLSFKEENPITLYAQWVEVDKVNYKVRHLLQKISATEPNTSQTVGGRIGTIESGGRTYYTYYTVGAEEENSDFPGDETIASFATAALITNLANYEPKGTASFADAGLVADIEQSLIDEDGSTVVDIYYDVIPFVVTLDLNEGIDINGNESIEQIFYTETDSITLATPEDAGFSRRKYKFINWNTEKDASGDSYENAEVLRFIEEPATPITLYAQWELVVSSSGFDVEISAPEDVSVDIDDTVKGEVTITVTLPEGITASSYAWEIDNVRVIGATSNKLIIKNGDYSNGYHLLSCIVKDSNGNVYVATGGFVVSSE